MKTDSQLAAELVELHGDQAAAKVRRALLILDTFPADVQPERLAKFQRERHTGAPHTSAQSALRETAMLDHNCGHYCAQCAWTNAINDMLLAWEVWKLKGKRAR